LLVVAESRTSRRRVDAHATTFVARFPHGATEVRRLIAQPAAWPLDRPTLRGLWFLSPRTHATTRQRIVRPRRRS
jgi:hypothetical protein